MIRCLYVLNTAPSIIVYEFCYWLAAERICLTFENSVVDTVLDQTASCDYCYSTLKSWGFQLESPIEVEIPILEMEKT